MDNVQIENQLHEILKPHDFILSGFSSLENPLAIEIYKSWLKQDFHGDMSYLETHLPHKENPKTWQVRAESAIVVAAEYFPHPKSASPFPGARISLYAQGEDYHFWFKARLMKTCQDLRAQFPEHEFLPFTDSAPVIERDLAYRAGLGWIGKNTCLINQKKGSLFFIGEIITSLKLTSSLPPPHDFCGHCTRCIEACPTQAIVESKKIDARRCISYLTIESKSVPPIELREKMGDWLFGCDICQTVCPWNQKQLKLVPVTASNGDLIEDLRFILTASGKKIEEKIYGTPLMRARPFGLRRNALVIVGNKKILELETDVRRFADDPKLGELAQWTLNILLLPR